MKAVQTRSPIHLAYDYANLNNVIVSIWVSDTVNIDITTTPDYQLNSQAINNFATVEISELIRSKNDYIFNPDFYEKRDTAKYVLIRGVLLDDSQTQLEVKYDFLRVRDGYITRDETPQIYKNLIPTDVRDWSTKFNNTITASQVDPFGGNDAYLVADSDNSNIFILREPLTIKGIHTLSVYVKRDSLGEVISLATSATKRVDFNVNTGQVENVGGSPLSFDMTLINGFYLISVVYDIVDGDVIRIASQEAAKDENYFIFNPKLTKGNTLNNSASELLLQDNTVIFDTLDKRVLFQADRKYTPFDYTFAANNITSILGGARQSAVLFGGNFDLIYDRTNNQETFLKITRNVLNECKHNPTKVSFINRFGVIQDLVFFKKRTDNIDTDKESFKTNVLQQGNYYTHIGQNQTIRKESKRSVTLNSGFYPEEFNTVFEQLQNSLHYWIDDEPAVLEGSSFNVKTRVNDKLINYTFDFSYSNEEVNTI